MAKPVAKRSSLSKLCKDNGVDSGYVAKQLPKLAQKSVTEFRLNATERHDARVDSAQTQLTTTATLLMDQGVYPSYRKLRKELGDSISFRDPVLCQLRNDLISSRRSGQKQIHKASRHNIAKTS